MNRREEQESVLGCWLLVAFAIGMVIGCLIGYVIGMGL